ncbi:MAG: hypothetical protein ABEH38_00040 [Flavobacteriales bacterium]
MDQQRFKVSGRIPKEEAVRKMQSAHILLAPSFPDTPGTYGSKIFDYLRAERPILAFPEDDGTIAELVRSTNTGTVLDTPEAIKEEIRRRYEEFEREGDVRCDPDKEAIQRYSRRAQVAVFAEALDSFLGSEVQNS